jgi:hypothetical protein
MNILQFCAVKKTILTAGGLQHLRLKTLFVLCELTQAVHHEDIQGRKI